MCKRSTEYSQVYQDWVDLNLWLGKGRSYAWAQAVMSQYLLQPVLVWFAEVC